MPNQIKEFMHTECDIVKVQKVAMSVRVFSGHYAREKHLAPDFVFKFLNLEQIQLVGGMSWVQNYLALSELGSRILQIQLP